jgi:hypothetical protein
VTFRSVVDAWFLELNDVPGLEDATTHRYASWSSNAIADTTPGRHLAIWPESQPEVRKGMTTDYSDEVTTTYAITVWEGATAEMERVFDDDDHNAAWLALFEAVRARLYLKANLAIGDAGSDIHYLAGAFDRIADKRFFVIRFTKRNYLSFT